MKETPLNRRATDKLAAIGWKQPLKEVGIQLALTGIQLVLERLTRAIGHDVSHDAEHRELLDSDPNTTSIGQ